MTPSTSPTALVLGGTSGIGRAAAERLLARGIPVRVVGRPGAKFDRVATELAALGPATATAVDLADAAQVEAFERELATSSEPLGYLVNAAGYFSPKPFLEHGREDYDRYHDLNRSSFFITQAVARNMAKHGGGSIVNIGSMWAKQAIKATPSSAYSMAKAGLHALTQHLAMELADAGIRVNAVAPAVVHTPIYGSFIEPSQIAAQLQGFNDFHPIGRIIPCPAHHQLVVRL